MKTNNPWVATDFFLSIGAFSLSETAELMKLNQIIKSFINLDSGTKQW